MYNPTIQIVSGKFRGRKLASPQDRRVHPMGSREKNALLNMLQPYLSSQTKVLDAYAGSGAVGLEALSRGVQEVIFVEKVPAVARLISDNLTELGFLKQSENPPTFQLEQQLARIIVGDVAKLSANSNFTHISASQTGAPDQADIKFDLIIADPPYEHFDPAEIAKLLTYLKDDGILALSHPKKSSANSLAELANLTIINNKTYAGAQITLYRRVKKDADQSRNFIRSNPQI